MTNFTRKGSDELDARIRSDLKLIETAVSPFCEAGILLGSYGRGEGTPLILPDGSQAPFNDYDLVVISKTVNSALTKKLHQLKIGLSEKTGLPVDLFPYKKSRLSTREFSLLNYEMKYGHRVVWGDENILSAMPEYACESIPRSEGTRLLLNRGKLLLDIGHRLKKPEPLTDEEHMQLMKFLIKAILALGDSILLASGRYALSYTAKKRQIKRIGSFPASGYIIDGYRLAVEMKEWGEFHAWRNFNITEEFKTVREVYLRYFPWYRARVSSGEGAPLKNMLQNLKWTHTLSTNHPREKLYDAVIALLQDDESVITRDQFYRLWRRFS